MIRPADSHVAVCGNKDRETDRCRLTDEDERVRVQSNVVPGDRTVGPFAGIGEPDSIVDGELNQPDIILQATFETGRSVVKWESE